MNTFKNWLLIYQMKCVLIQLLKKKKEKKKADWLHRLIFEYQHEVWSTLEFILAKN